MLIHANPERRWSEFGIYVLIGSVVASVVLALADGVLRGKIYGGASDQSTLQMLSTWASDFRYLADQAIYSAVIFIVGAKFIETRTIFTIGFDRLDAAKIKVEGPDEDNIVWIGRRYATRFEAEAIAETIAERLKESAAS